MIKAAREVAYFLNNRPLCFLSTVFSLRDVFMGSGLLFNRPDISRTILFHNLDQLGSARLYGLILLLVGVYTMATAIKERTKWTKFGLRMQSWFWLFACFSYLLNGNILLAAVFGFMCSIPSGYIAYYYKYNPLWDGPKRAWREKYGIGVRVK